MDVRDILRMYAEGRITEEEAEKSLRMDYLDRIGDSFVFDVSRGLRKGIPEVVYALAKTPGQVAQIASASKGFLLISKASKEHYEAVSATVPGAVYDERSKTISIGKYPEGGKGLIAIMAAGTSDIPVAEEAKIMAAAMGVDALTYYDVGVSAVHRISGPLKEMEDADVDAVIVAAGMEGTLPTLVASLSRAPVIGLPVSTGYGIGGAGAAALLSMLQSCSPGLTVVNVDNGIGAGAAAATMALRRRAR